MGVVCRFVVTEVSLLGWATRVKLTAQMPQEGDPHYDEIKSFFEATPQGSFEATIKNDLAAEQFQPRKAFYLRLEPVPEAEPVGV
jgi:hypothetical protein